MYIHRQCRVHLQLFQLDTYMDVVEKVLCSTSHRRYNSLACSVRVTMCLLHGKGTDVYKPSEALMADSVPGEFSRTSEVAVRK